MPDIRMPDGTIVRFPDDMPPDQIRGMILKKFPEAQQLAAQPREAESGANEIANVALGGFLEGIPVAGPMLRSAGDHIGAGVRSLMSGKSYEDELQFVREATGQLKERHPYVDTGAQIAGSVAGTVPMVMAAPGAFGVGASSRLGAAGASAMSGAAIGGADAGVRSGGDGSEMLKGAAIGVALGAAAPLAAEGVGKAYQAARGYFVPGPAGYSRGATQRVGGAVADDLAIGPAYAQRAADMGPDGMLLNLGPRTTGQAQALAIQPNAAKTTIRTAMDAQRRGANARLGADLDSALGPAQTPSVVESGLRAQRSALGPRYERAMDAAPPIDPSDVVQTIDDLLANAKGPMAGRLRQARSMIARPNPKAGTPGQPAELLETNARGLHNARIVLDDVLEDLNRSGASGTAARIKAVRAALDDALKSEVPGMPGLDARFHALSKQSEALKDSATLLDSGRSALRPDELARQRAGMSAGQRRMQAVGTRAEIDRLVGTKANDLVALKQAVKGEGDWNRAKLAQIFGPDEADRVFRAVDREAAFDDAYRRIIGNSETAARQAGAAEFPTTAPDGIAQDRGGATLFGLGARFAGWAADKFSNGAVTASRNRIAEDAARMLTKAGPERDALVQALMLQQMRQGQIAQTRPTAEAIARAILLSGQVEAGRAVTPQR